MEINPLFLTSIVISAAIGGFITGCFLLTSQFLERQGRRRELLLSKSIELAQERRRTLLEVTKDTNQTVTLLDDITLAEEYYVLLEHLFKKGTLPKKHKESVARQLEAIETAKKLRGNHPELLQQAAIRAKRG